MKTVGRILILLTLFGPAGCLMRMGAPCAGFGCPAFAPKSSAQTQQAPAQTAQDQKSSKRSGETVRSAVVGSTAKPGQ